MTGRLVSLVYRDAEMLLLYRDGKTLQEIGNQYGVTRELVRQVMSLYGISGNDGGAAIRHFINIDDRASREASRVAGLERFKQKTWGLTVDAYWRIRADHGYKPFCAFNSQRNNAKKRGIA